MIIIKAKYVSNMSVSTDCCFIFRFVSVFVVFVDLNFSLLILVVCSSNSRFICYVCLAPVKLFVRENSKPF